jgi:tRNA pseudouridine38-40 synthase
MRVRLVLEYDGTDFAGYQLQPGNPSIQGAVEEALAVALRHPVRLAVAGRTDSGVHARMQVCAFETDRDMPADRLRAALNGLLPASIGCIEVAEAPPGFDPRRAPHRKQYVYRWLDRPGRSPLRARTVWHVARRLDDRAMALGASHLVGQHDFTSFRAAGCAAKTPVRTIPRVEVVRLEDEVHLITEGTGYLRHMVRIVAGTLLDVGRGVRPPEWVAEVLAARDRAVAGKTAPAKGLTLEWIRYD